MRNKIRIETFLNKVDIRNLLIDIWKICDDTNIDKVEKDILDNIVDIKEKWNYMPDLRFSQVLIGLNYITNQPGSWFYYEEDQILKLQGHKPRDYVFWGNLYDKDGIELSEVNYILIKNLNTDHIQKLINSKWIKKGSEIYEIMCHELLIRTRKEKLSILSGI